MEKQQELKFTDAAYTARVIRMDENDGLMKEAEVANIDYNGNFLIDQLYFFPVNDPDGEDGSVTYIRAHIPKGTYYADGYKAIRDMLEGLGMVPSEVAFALDMPEIMAE